MEKIYDYIVIGRGLIGAAAFRYLSKESKLTLLIGPDEPLDKTNHDGVFGAHYDSGRLTHLHSKSPIWGELCRRSIANYRMLEDHTGRSFYNPVGELFVTDANIESAYHDPYNIEYSRKKLGAELFSMGSSEQQRRIPGLAFADDSKILWERKPAGVINPRVMLQAQVVSGQKDGGRILQEIAVATESDGELTAVSLKNGKTVRGKKVLVAAGSFSNGFELLPHKLPLQCKTETIILGEVSDDEAERLRALPVVHYDLANETLSNIYMVPPVRYPNGRFYIKLGANTVADRFVDSVEGMQEWYARGDSDGMLDALKTAVLQMVPGIQVEAWHTDRCMITRTPSGFPIIDAVVPEKLYVAVGGNGSSAACADALGELAAKLMVHNRWKDHLEHLLFQV